MPYYPPASSGGGGSPTGAAGGDLSGTYPNPSLYGSSNAEDVIRNTSMDQMAPPMGVVNMNNQRIFQMAQGIAPNDAARMDQSNGWILEPNGSGLGTGWARVSNTQFTVNTDVTGIYKNGVYLKWLESTVPKYGIVASSSYNSGTALTTVTMQTIDRYTMGASPDFNSNWYGYGYGFKAPSNITVSAAIAGGVSVALTPGTTVLTTPTLDIGTWLFKVSLSCTGGAATRMFTTNVSVASGSATALPTAFPLTGTTIGFGTATATANSYVEAVVTVTAAATFTVNGTALVAAVTTHADASSYFLATKIQ